MLSLCMCMVLILILMNQKKKKFAKLTGIYFNNNVMKNMSRILIIVYNQLTLTSCCILFDDDLIIMIIIIIVFFPPEFMKFSVCIQCVKYMIMLTSNDNNDDHMKTRRKKCRKLPVSMAFSFSILLWYWAGKKILWSISILFNINMPWIDWTYHYYHHHYHFFFSRFFGHYNDQFLWYDFLFLMIIIDIYITELKLRLIFVFNLYYFGYSTFFCVSSFRDHPWLKMTFSANNDDDDDENSYR